MPLSVYVCDDDYLVREGAKAALSAVEDIVVEATAQHGDALLEMVEAAPPDAVIVDIRMPPTHTTEGIEVAMRLRSTHPEIGIVVLSQHDDPAYALELLGDGSEGMAYLLKERLGDVDRPRQRCARSSPAARSSTRRSSTRCCWRRATTPPGCGP